MCSANDLKMENLEVLPEVADAFFEIGTAPSRSCYNCSHGCKGACTVAMFGCPLWEFGGIVPCPSEYKIGFRPAVLIADESSPFGRKEWDAASDMFAERKKEGEDK